MASNRTPTRFFGPGYLLTGGATLYTVPGSKIAVIRSITIVNAGADDLAILTVNGTATDDGVAVWQTVGDVTVTEWQYLVLAAGDTLQGSSDGSSTSMVITVDGDLYDA